LSGCLMQHMRGVIVVDEPRWREPRLANESQGIRLDGLNRVPGLLKGAKILNTMYLDRSSVLG
jgi:hypothetical protein